MVIDFSKIDLKEQPVLVLRNLDGTAIQTLGYALNRKTELCYDEISNVTFDLPAYVEGVKTPHYDDVVGTRIIDMVGWGQFILINPSIEKDGIKEIKSCKAYSLEYELTFKKISLEEGTYNFYNPVTPDDTLIGIILSYLPSWSLGEIDDELIGKYRTFSISNENIYNFIKSTVQKTYDCIFEFDTYNRKISVRAVSSKLSTSPIFISLNNLAKSISVEEDTENIFTVLDVNGADGVSIRSVNPMGTNKIYNLDYYMNKGYFSEDIIARWQEWKRSYENYQLSYYNLTIEKMLKTAAIITEENRLKELTDADLASLENSQAVLIEYLASISDKDNELYVRYQTELSTVNTRITEKNREISSCKNLISSLNTEKNILTEELVAINKATSFSNYFTADELIILNRYFKEDSIEDSSFVVRTTEAYTDDDISSTLANTNISFSGGSVRKTTLDSGKDIFTIEGGTLSANNGVSLTANIIRACVERKNTGDFVLSGYLGLGSLHGNNFVSGCISLTGNCESMSSNVAPDSEVGGEAYQVGTELSFYINSARLYFTRNTTEYEQFSVEWDLYKYGCECLNRLAYPSYTFDIASANFLALDDFEEFAKKLSLGNKLYLALGEDSILEPIFVGVSIDFEKISSIELQFGDAFSLNNSAFSLVDLLEKSVSMGKTVDTSRFSYNSFIDSGAATTVKTFMDSALDVSKNAILSGGNMAISWGNGGIRCRKWTDDGTAYEPEQIAIINNSIIFTDDSWQSAKMAIGHFADTNLGDTWGVVAPNIVGTLLAGSNLVIESAKKDGGVSVFRVDANGAVLHNARFDIENDVSHIVLDPELGFGIGDYPIVNTENIWDEDRAKFWVDTVGNIHLKGTLEGCGGEFSGSLKAATGTFNGELQAASGSFKGIVQASDFKDSAGNSMMDGNKFASKYLSLYGLEVKSGNTLTFKVDSLGNVTINGNVTMTGGAINWSNINETESTAYQNATSSFSYALSAVETANTANASAVTANSNASSALSETSNLLSDVRRIINGQSPQYITGTFISGTTIQTPILSSAIITGGTITGAEIYWGDLGTYGSLTRVTGSDGVSNTNLVALSSNYGMLLSANTNMRIQCNGGIWFTVAPSSIHMYTGNSNNRGYDNLITIINTEIANYLKNNNYVTYDNLNATMVDHVLSYH